MKKASNSSLHYVVTGPSLMQDLPQVTVKVCDHDRAMSTWSQLKRGSYAQRHSKDDFSTVEIVHGRAGGYIIHRQLMCNDHPNLLSFNGYYR